MRLSLLLLALSLAIPLLMFSIEAFAFLAPLYSLSQIELRELLLASRTTTSFSTFFSLRLYRAEPFACFFSEVGLPLLLYVLLRSSRRSFVVEAKLLQQL